jgi:magnesium-transporting ATPase (P-type)
MDLNGTDGFDVIVFEWLIVFAGLALLGFVAAWVTRRSLRELRGIPHEERQAAESELWHTLRGDEVMRRLEVTHEGLDAQAAAARLAEYGPNRLPEAKRTGPWIRFLVQFHNILIYVLLAAGAVTALLQHWLDAGVILGVVLINALIGFIQEGKAEDALEAIRKMLSPRAMVLRGGHRITVDAIELVPGDVVPLQAGDKVPADLRLFKARGLQIEEAALTGESMPVEKHVETLPPNTVIGDRRCMAYSGTLVTTGQGLGVVVETGAGTELGRISALVSEVQQLTTPLLRQMAQFGRWLTLAILLLAGLSFGFGVLVRDYLPSEMFLAAVGLAVAAIPEGLPAIMTITLAIGVQRMAARNAIIRRLPAVETLGTVAVICSDKTGTLTCNEMTVRRLVIGCCELEVSGSGYDPHGDFLIGGEEHPVDADPALLQSLRAAVLCNDAELEQRDGEWRIQGDPMEAALLVAGMKAGLDPEQEIRRYPRTDLIPFDAAHRFMATLHHSHEGDAFIFLKGAPEKLLELCSRQLVNGEASPLDRDFWQGCVHDLAARGYRVLAVAQKSGQRHQAELDFEDVADKLVLLGLFGIIDPPRPEAITAARQCRDAGIRVKMITGDHAVTAAAIARQIGLANTGEVLTGAELELMSEEELREQVEAVDVYARVSPEHKLRLVSALQATGVAVAMTGDGVNDAPALKRADVGVAMGHNGTEAAKEAAEMVLADDNFASIVSAVEEGRTVYDNIRKAILFILPTNGGEALVILGAILLGFHQFPLTPVQILWVNMITAVTLALALAFEPPEPNVMRRPPRDPAQPVLSGLFLWRIGFVSLILMSGTFGLFIWDIEAGASIEHARTVAVNTLVMFEIFYLFNSRYIMEPVLNREGLFGNRYILMAVVLLLLFQLAFTYLPPLQTLFGTTAIDAGVWGRIVLVASSVLLLVELEKALVRRFLPASG